MAQRGTAKAFEGETVQAFSGVDYQAFWTTNAPKGWIDEALGQAADWVRERLGLDVDLSKDGEALSRDRSKRVQVLHRRARRDAGVRLRAWNTNNGVTFTITVLAVDGPNGGWLLVQAASSDRTRKVAKPAVADRILDVIDFIDVGPLRVTAQHITHRKLDDLEDLINHPDRRFPVIVGAPVDGVEFDRWLNAVTRWTRHCAGIAHAASLDPYSAAEFNRRHGRRAVQPATLRTYPPGADLSDPAVEHTARWLTPRSLVGDDEKIARVIESFVRQHQVTSPVPLPSSVREWSRAFDRFAAQQLRSAVSPDPAPLEARIAARQAAQNLRIPVPAPAIQPRQPAGDQTALPDGLDSANLNVLEVKTASLQKQLDASENARIRAQTQLSNVQEFLSLPDFDEASLLELLDAATQSPPDSDAISRLLSDNEALQNKVEELEDKLLMEQLNSGDMAREHGRLEVYYEKLTREAAFLRSKLTEHDPVGAFSWVDDGGPSNPLGQCPADWDTFLDDPRLSEHGLMFTGNQRRTKEVASLDLDGAGLRAAWDAFGTLASYRHARLNSTWGTNVHSFCETGPPGVFRVPPNKHAQDESSITRKNKRLAAHRLLPVPESVDASGRVHMWAHFKPHSWSAQQKLRIHYYDQVAIDGNLYIGHIGHHLPSGSTDKVHR